MLPRTSRLPLLLLTALALGGCDPISGTAVGVSSLSATKKLPPDHAISAITGRDCSVVSFEQTGEYCPPPAKEIDRSDTHCFRTLGGVDCYNRPDPYHNRNQPLASPPPRPVTP
jgi:hypothetical protein